jgi:hypothetical protein
MMKFAGTLPRYPWTKWFSQKQFRLRQGKDFHCQVHSMMIQVRFAAARMGRKVTVHLSDTGLVAIPHPKSRTRRG